MGSEFPEYASKFSKDARESRDKLPKEARKVLSDIVDELTEDPEKHLDRVISVGDNAFIYMYPDKDDPIIQVTYGIDHKKKHIKFFHFSAPSLKVKKTIFISYSHKDKKWLDKLKIFLSVLEQRGLVKFWDDDQLESGKPWEPQIEEVLDSSVAGVLLVSQEFLSSKFINERELPRLLSGAEKKGKHIFWIPVSPSTVFETHKEITEYQSPVKDPKTSLAELGEAQQKKVFVHISKELSDAVTKH